MKKIPFILPLLALLFSCKRKTGDVELVLEINAGSEPPAIVSEQIKKRITTVFSCGGDDVKVQPQGNLFSVSFPCFDKDSASEHRLSRMFNFEKSEFGFWEVYDNLELNDKWEPINAVVKAALGDSTIEQMLKTRTSGIKISSDENMVRDSILKKYPVSIFLIPSVDQRGYLVPGPVAGYAEGKDTAKLNSLLQLRQLREDLTRNMIFCWQVKPAENGKDIYALYCLKKINEGPVLSGDQITDASTVFQQGMPCVSFRFGEAAAVKWKEITERLSSASSENNRKAIAMTLHNKVLSAPVVASAIPNGESQVSGNFTVKECEEFVAAMKAPFRFSSKVVSVRIAHAE